MKFAKLSKNETYVLRLPYLYGVTLWFVVFNLDRIAVFASADKRFQERWNFGCNSLQNIYIVFLTN